jgi:hypothetical protein
MDASDEQKYLEIRREIEALLVDIANHPLCPEEIRSMIIKEDSLITGESRVLRD